MGVVVKIGLFVGIHALHNGTLYDSRTGRVDDLLAGLRRFFLGGGLLRILGRVVCGGLRRFFGLIV